MLILFAGGLQIRLSDDQRLKDFPCDVRCVRTQEGFS